MPKHSVRFPLILLLFVRFNGTHLNAQTFSIIYDVITADGLTDPETRSPLAIDSQGSLYGSADITGPTGRGTVFEISPPSTSGAPWTLTTLYEFVGCAASCGPSNVVFGSNGQLYGVTAAGGPSGRGTVFELTPPSSPGGSWGFSTLYTFSGTDGAGPVNVVVGRGGILYGVTVYGGSSNLGTVFSLSPPSGGGSNWTETVLHNFAGAPADGASPLSGLLLGPAGGAYGVTNLGGANNLGTVFQLRPQNGETWTENVLHSFALSEGADPRGTLAYDRKGNLYGTTFREDLDGPFGTVFMLTRPESSGGNWTLSTLFTFASVLEGQNPASGVIFGSDGALYGTTASGGACCNPQFLGTVFRLAPPSAKGGAWQETVLQSFFGDYEGKNPGALVLGANGVMYGVAQAAIFELTSAN